MNTKPIPGTLGYSASDTGVIYDPDGIVRNHYVNGDGYLTASVKLVSGLWRTVGVHRLVCLAHLDSSTPVDDLTVNHKDKNIQNNHLTNLEWLSVALNNTHAALKRGSPGRPVILASYDRGGHMFLNTLEHAAAELEMDEDLIWEHIRDARPIHGWTLTHFTSRSVIPESLRKPDFMQKGRVGKIPSRPLSVLDVELQLVEHFDSLIDVAKRFKVDPSHITQLVSVSGSKNLFKRKYIIVDKGTPFPEITEEELRRLRGPTGFGVAAYNLENEMYALFESASQFVKLTGLSKKAVTTRLKKGKIEWVGDWIFTYLTSDSKEKLGRVIQTRLDAQQA